MNHNSHHIISSLTWNTSFAEKEKAHDLQTRLSSWSRFTLQREINSILDEFCSPKEIWGIDSLELNIGPVDFSNLEQELSLKIRKELFEKLQDLYLQIGNNPLKVYEILNEHDSAIQLLSHFLQHGFLPWNKQSSSKNIKQIFHEQVANDPKSVMKMLHAIAHKDKVVRKRIAWQIDEPGIVWIINMIEPGNSKQIIDFSKKLVQIQEKESIVSSGSHEFNKDLWHWILNYLFTNHGSSFNKKQFLKSSLQQMSVHFNIRYDRLLKIIDKTLHKINFYAGHNSNILTLLEIITIENYIHKQEITTNKTENSQEFINKLRFFFQRDSFGLLPKKRKELNEVIIRFSTSQPNLFRATFLSPDQLGKQWIHILSQLENNALYPVLEVWAMENSARLIAFITVFIDLGRRSGLSINPVFIRKSAIRFFYMHKNEVFNTSKLIEYLISSLETAGGISGNIILARLTATQISASAKSLTEAECYDELAEISVSRILTSVTADTKSRIAEILQILSRSNINMVQRMQFEKLLLQSIQRYPAISLQILVQYPGKENLQKILPGILNESLSRLLLRSNKDEKYYLLREMEQEMHKQKTEIASVAELISGLLYNTAASDIILNPNHSVSQFYESVAGECFKLVPHSLIQQFRFLITSLFGRLAANVHNISAKAIEKINTLYGSSYRGSLMEGITELLTNKPHNQLLVCKLLSEHGSKTILLNLANRNSSGIDLLLNYILPGSEQQQHNLITKYSTLLHQHTSLAKKDIDYRLNVIFWNCLLSFNSYSGNMDRFKALFHAAVLFNFPGTAAGFNRTETAKDTSRLQKNKQPAVKFTDSVIAEKISMIQKYLDTYEESTEKGSIKYHLKEFFAECSSKEIDKLTSIINKIPGTESKLNLLISVIDFYHFANIMMREMEPRNYTRASVLCFLYRHLDVNMPGKMSEEIQLLFWNRFFNLIRKKDLPNNELKEIIITSVLLLKKGTNKGLPAIYEEMQKEDPWLGRLVCRFAGINSAVQKIKKQLQNKLLRHGRKGWMVELFNSFISQQEIPLWFTKRTTHYNEKELLNAMILYFPLYFLETLEKGNISGSRMLWLFDNVDFPSLIKIIGRSNKKQELQLGNILKLYVTQKNNSWKGSYSILLNQILFGIVLKAWSRRNWSVIDNAQLWQEVFKELAAKRGISKKILAEEIKLNIHMLPISLQHAFNLFADHDRPAPQLKTNHVTKEKAPLHKKLSDQSGYQSPAKEGITVYNAGLVLLNNYISMLFDRLGITENNRFIDEQKQLDSVHILQYLVTGLTQADENFLPLNKVLCGLDISKPVADTIIISDSTKEITEGLINACIGFWPQIGKTSLDGFRGNWLVRKGILKETNDKWDLFVEKQVYDILLSKAPFSFSMIRLPWMNKPLHVSWQY